MISAEENGTLILFEVVSAFLMEAYNSNLRDLLYFKDDGEKLVIKVNGNELLNEVLEKWSYKGINQYGFFTGCWRHPMNNYYGRFFACMQSTFEFDTNHLMEFFADEENQLVLDCKLFWKSYTMCQ